MRMDMDMADGDGVGSYDIGMIMRHRDGWMDGWIRRTVASSSFSSSLTSTGSRLSLFDCYYSACDDAGGMVFLRQVFSSIVTD